MSTGASFAAFRPAAAAMHWWTEATTALMADLHSFAKVRKPETFRHRAFDQAATEREMWRL
jgi:hypothetical protein